MTARCERGRRDPRPPTRGRSQGSGVCARSETRSRGDTMQDESALGRAVAMVADLRARCDWDRVQTRETLRPYLIEEVHELDAALASGDRESIRDEVGDLMLHLSWQLVLGLETGEFTPD